MKRKICTDLCIGCGSCVTDCINQNIFLQDTDSGTKACFKERSWCIECGHCNAVCPCNAIIGGKWEDSFQDFDVMLELFAKKRTVRQYDASKTISQKDLNKLIYAAQTAPTDRNRKSARILFVKELLPEIYNKSIDYLVKEVKKVGTIHPLYQSTLQLDAHREVILWNAEYLVLLCGSANQTTDAILAAERMQLEAEYLGLATGYRGDMLLAINQLDELRQLLEMKRNECVLNCFALGYPKITYKNRAVKFNKKVEFK